MTNLVTATLFAREDSETANKVVTCLQIFRAGRDELILIHRDSCLLWRKCVVFITKSKFGMGIALESVIERKHLTGKFIKKV